MRASRPHQSLNSSILPKNPNVWGQRVEDVEVPVGARKIRLTMLFYHQGVLVNSSARANISWDHPAAYWQDSPNKFIQLTHFSRWTSVWNR